MDMLFFWFVGGRWDLMGTWEEVRLKCCHVWKRLIEEIDEFSGTGDERWKMLI
jgi:hypothetical protein